MTRDRLLQHRSWGLVFGVGCCLFRQAAAMADDLPSTGPAPDKSIYSLLNPVPTDQMRDMETDRPDRTNTPNTIDAGHLQLESGISDLTFFRHGSARNDLISAGEEDLRVGIFNRMEISLAATLFNSVPVPSATTGSPTRHEGVGDLFLGGTVNLWGDDAGDRVWATSLGLQPIFKLPTAASKIGNGHFETFFGIPFLVNLPAGAHLGAETVVSDERNTSDDGNVTGWQNMFAVDRTFFGFDIYVEYWSHLTSEQHRKAQQSIDTGFTCSLSDSVVLDTGFNFGLNGATSDFEWVTGISIRY
jgi:hypothetical protein